MKDEKTMEDKAQEVSVTDPQNYGEGRSRYTAYLVECTFPSKTQVRRRYSDFQWLYQRLMVERPGAIVPIIPHKQAVRESVRFSEELLTERQATLETFLKQVHSSPELQDAPSLRTFLTAYNQEWEHAQADHPAGLAGEAGSGGLLGKVRAKLAVAGVSEQLEVTPDDGAMEIMEEYLTHMDSCVKVWAKESAALVKQSKESAKSLQAMGASFSALGKKPYPQAYSDETGQLSTELASHISDISIVVLKQSDQAKMRFEDPMQELARHVQAAKAALARRKEIVWEYTKKQQAVKSKKASLEKGKSSEQEVSDAQSEAKAALKEVEVVSKRVRREVERFREFFYEKLKATMKDSTKLQTEYHSHMDKKWAAIMPVVTDDGDQVTAPVSAPPPAPAPASAPPAPPTETANGETAAKEGADSIQPPMDLLL
jgi:sorting nexin-1/2